ncbi:3-isopropylmalate dehydrogenase [Listeria sp. PSOL-1]|uniref:3-isopropylmalate dehydrogenase n=1 Tax=Listeria sp. PSOL-1 TaxID=1844999 RepID=UPI0013D2542B|nr:3-isopropylmalate dehydrogenase [Listeria sp. PSOL-1]
MSYLITVLPGDGIGPEIMSSGIAVLKTVGQYFQHDFKLEEHAFGGAAIDLTGKPLPEKTLTACKHADAILLAAIGGPKWDLAPSRPEDGLLALRKELGLFANIRPISISEHIAHLSPLKKEVVAGSDFVVVRELTGGLYFGEPKYWNEKKAIDTLSYSSLEIERILIQAFELAKKRRKKVTSVDKANVLASSKLWRKTADRIAKNYPEITLEHLYVDAAAMHIIKEPQHFDVIVTENLFGDILSDEASVIVGSLGVLPSASHGEAFVSLYEPIHGSAPNIAGENVANPISMILSVSMMLEQSFHLTKESAVIKQAVENTLTEGFLTKDLGGDTTTTAFTNQVIHFIREGAKKDAADTF